MRNIIRTIITASIVAVMSLIGSAIVFGFTLPTLPAPGANIADPLNQLSFYQEKVSTLGASRFFGIDPLRFFDPAGESVIEGVLDTSASETNRVVSISMDPGTLAHIVDVRDPLDSQDAANKRWTDLRLGNVPNLTVTSMSAMPTVPGDTEQFVIDVTIENNGRRDAETGVRFEIRDTSGTVIQNSTGGECAETIPVGSLSGNTTYNTSCTVGPWAAGSFTLTGVIDVNDDVAEADESDNETAMSVNVIAKPNFILTSAGVQNAASTQVFQATTFVFNVTNGGTGDSLAPATVRIYEDTTLICETTVGPLVAGASDSPTCQYAPGFSNESHNFSAVIDEDDAIDETNESDNTDTFNFSPWAVPSMSITGTSCGQSCSLYYTGYPLYTYEYSCSYSCNVTFKNTGYASFGNAADSWMIGPGVALYGSQMQDLPNLAPGQSSSRSFSKSGEFPFPSGTGARGCYNAGGYSSCAQTTF